MREQDELTISSLKLAVHTLSATECTASVALSAVNTNAGFLKASEERALLTLGLWQNHDIHPATAGYVP